MLTKKQSYKQCAVKHCRKKAVANGMCAVHADQKGELATEAAVPKKVLMKKTVVKKVGAKCDGAKKDMLKNVCFSVGRSAGKVKKILTVKK